MTCLLCKSSNTTAIDRVSVEQIVNSYLKQFKTDFGYLFSNKEIVLNECTDCGLRFYSPPITGDEKYYNTIQKNSWYYREDKEEYTYAASFVKENDDVLDIGCGSGHFSKYIPQANFTGLEFSPDAIKTGSEKGRKIYNETVQDHSLKNGSKYDVVTTFQVLEHVSAINDFVKSAAACVKAGGKLIIAVPSDESYLKFVSNGVLNMPPHHISRWTDKALISVSRVTSLNLLEIHHESMDPIHKMDFVNNFILKCLESDLATNSKIANKSLGHFIRRNISYRLAKHVSKKGVDNAFLPIGQSVIAVYQKPAL